MLWLYLKYRTTLYEQELRLLHFAPEVIFRNLFMSLPNLDYVSADLDSPIAKVKMNIMNIACRNDAFGAILCSHVLEHVTDDKAAMRELFRVLRPGGWAILQAPVFDSIEETREDPTAVAAEERERLFGQWDHLRKYGRDYKDRLEEAGFRVVVEPYVEQLSSSKVKRYGLNRKEDIYLCFKPEN